MGADVDEVLAYQTPKVVKIKDRLLGVLKYIFMFTIFLYVIVWQVLYKGSHFQMDHLSGVARLQLQQPTRRCNPMDIDCSSNYTSLQKLPYCSQYRGDNASIVQRECKYYDALDLLTPMDGGYLVPSYIETFDQHETCEPNRTNKFKCDKKYEFVDEDGKVQDHDGRAKAKGKFFVADVESFTLLIDHSFRVDTGSVEYDDYKMQGYWLDCSEKHNTESWTPNTTWLATDEECERRPIVCLHEDCKKLHMITEDDSDEKKKGEDDSDDAGKAVSLVSTSSQEKKRSLRKSRSSVSRGDSMQGQSQIVEKSGMRSAIQDASARLQNKEVFSLKAGDVLSIRTLFAMAGRHLDDSWYDESDKVNMTTRKRGTVLVVNIHYNNLRPWTLLRPKDPPEYEISVTSRPVEKYKQMKITKTHEHTREMVVSYGTLVIVQSSGTIGVFRMIHMLIVISTSLGLLAASSVLTDLLALYVLPMRDEYTKAKFQETDDLHDLAAKREEEAHQA
jgi:hypothetical protein